MTSWLLTEVRWVIKKFPQKMGLCQLTLGRTVYERNLTSVCFLTWECIDYRITVLQNWQDYIKHCFVTFSFALLMVTYTYLAHCSVREKTGLRRACSSSLKHHPLTADTPQPILPQILFLLSKTYISICHLNRNTTWITQTAALPWSG